MDKKPKPEEININWFTKLLLRFWPGMAMRYFAKRAGIKNPLFDKAHDLFSQIKSIDIIPTGIGRGFMIIIDGKTALYFYQNGDHFVYDGFEIGEYKKGDVTIFDEIKK